MKDKLQFLAQIAAAALTIALFVVGGHPAAATLFSGAAHHAAHFAAYGAIAFAYALGFPRWPTLAVAALVAAIGCAHEYYEITAHGHEFEYVDAGVNSLGALAGALIARLRHILAAPRV